jgi:hypothetical protein
MADTSKPGRRKARKTKDRTLQARIPKQLDEELRDQAEQLGLSVSTVVRNVLLNTFDLVEGVVSDSAQLARTIQGRAPVPDAEPEPESEPAIIGWQEAILNRNGVCENCNSILTKGESAAVGIPVQTRPVLLCLECLGTVKTEGEIT